MGSLSSLNRSVKYLFCVIDVFTKYAWVTPLKGKKAKTVLPRFIKIVNESKHKPNKLRVDQEREFHNSPMQKWLYENNILLCATHNEGKSVVPEGIIKTLRSKIYKKLAG